MHSDYQEHTMSKFIVVVIAAVAFSSVACASPSSAPGKQGAVPVAGKMQAPVEATAKTAGSSAAVTLSFAVAGTGVVVDVYGTNGLRVTSTNRPFVGDVSAGQIVKLDVVFDAPAGEANLAVMVTGVFGGVRSGKAVSFTVGQANASQAQKAAAGVKVEPDGEKVREMPAVVK